MASRQREWQLNQKALGLCELCNRPRVRYMLRNGTIKYSPLCERHLRKTRERRRNKTTNKQQEKPIIKEMILTQDRLPFVKEK